MNSQKRVLLYAVVVCSSLVYINSSYAITRYVSTNGTHASPFLTWGTASTTIQAAINVATTGDVVLVTNGYYNAGGKGGGSLTTSNRVMIDEAITVESVNGPSNTFIVGEGYCHPTASPPFRRCVWMGPNSVLSGFTLTNGATLYGGDDDGRGGGVWATSDSAMVTNCIITGCSAHSGGGMRGGEAYNSSFVGNSSLGVAGGTHHVDLYHCMIIDNYAEEDGGGCYYGTLTNCVVSGNESAYSGGGCSDANLYNCTVTSNSAPGNGGVSFGSATDCTISYNEATSGRAGGVGGMSAYNCSIHHNSAASTGGGVDGGYLANCIIWANKAANGGGVYQATPVINCTVFGNTNGGIYDSYHLRNSIFWDNDSYDVDPTCYEIVNLYTNDPQFVDASVGNLRLSSNSPCINGGLNEYAPTNLLSYDLDGNPRIVGGTVDFGAYEVQDVYFDIFAWADSNGMIAPSGTTFVAAQSNITFTITPAPYYHISDIQTNGSSAGTNSPFTWYNVLAPGTVNVYFAETCSPHGTPHWWMVRHGWTNSFDSVELGDQDGDGLYTWQEYGAGTWPTNAHTDGDQYDDGTEAGAGADPLRNDSATYGAIWNHPESYNLYSSNAMYELAVGNMMAYCISNQIQMRIQLQGCHSLQGPWSNVGSVVSWAEDIPTNMFFFRCRSGTVDGD